MSTCQIINKTDNLSVMWKTVSEACNLACDYCYYSRCNGRPGQVNRIPDKVLDTFIKEYMAFSNGTASFTWQGGEPLLAGLDFFRKIISLQAHHAPANTIISNCIQTNGTLITSDWAHFFKQYNFLVGVSLDGPERINDKRRPTGSGTGSFQAVLKGIEHLRNAKVDFNILTVLHEDNITKPKELMAFYKANQFNHVQFLPGMAFQSQNVGQSGNYVITPEQYGQFLCDVFDIWYNDGYPEMSIRFFDNMLAVYLNEQPELCTHRKSCPKSLVLEHNGDAYPCDFFIHKNYKLGNVEKDNLTDILNNPLYEKFLSYKEDLPETCRSCEFLPLCHGGCPRNRNTGPDDPIIAKEYFCESYKQIYDYAHNRMETVAINIKRKWIRQHQIEGRRFPERNDPCFCGSVKKFKKCCLPFVH